MLTFYSVYHRRYIGSTKNARANLQKVNLQHSNRKTYLINTDFLKYGFPVTACWRLKTMLSVHLEFPCRYCRRQASGTLISSTTSDWGCLPWFSTKRSSTTVARCGSADYGSFVVHVWCCCTTFCSCSSAVLEQGVSGTMDKTRWTNSMAWGHAKSTVCATKSVTHRTWNNRYRMHLRWFVRRLQFSSESGNQRSDVQRPVLTLKVVTLSTFFNLQQAVTR